VANQSPPGGSESASTRWRDRGFGVLIFFAAFFAYLPAINGGFLWDDDAHVTRPGLQSLEGLRRIWFEVGATQQYYPVLHSAFWIEHRLWGNAVLGYHLTNIFLHATAACLVVAVVRRLFRPAGEEPGRHAGVEWLAGFIFALHPVCTESVAWISEQKNTLSAVFCLGAALAYLSFDRDRRWSRYWLALGLFALALLSKTVTATLPAALLVVFWWQRGRLGWRRDVLPLLPWLALGVSGGLLTAWVERNFFVAVQASADTQSADFSLSFLERCLLAGRVIWFYLGKLLWPADLMFIYPRWTVDPAAWWQYLFPVGVLALAAGLVAAARRCRGPLAGFLIFAGTLFPALGFFDVYPFRYSYVADHFQYLASLGIIVPVAAGLTLAASSLRDGRRPTAAWFIRAGSALLVVILAVLTTRESGMYRDGGALYRQTLARNPGCWMAHCNLGLILAKNPNRLPEALAHFKEAVRLRPNDAQMHNYLGSALAGAGRKSDAIAEYETSLRLNPNFPYAHSNLGIVLMDAPGRLPDALAQFETAVRIKPDDAQMRNSLGNALARYPGREAEAVAEYETALRLDPDLADAHTNLGIALVDVPGRMPEAIRHFEEAARLDPGSASAHFNLGFALASTPQRESEALAQFEAAVRIKPDFEAARQWIERLRAGTLR